MGQRQHLLAYAGGIALLLGLAAACGKSSDSDPAKPHPAPVQNPSGPAPQQEELLACSTEFLEIYSAIIEAKRELGLAQASGGNPKSSKISLKVACDYLKDHSTKKDCTTPVDGEIQVLSAKDLSAPCDNNSDINSGGAPKSQDASDVAPPSQTRGPSAVTAPSQVAQIAEDERDVFAIPSGKSKWRVIDAKTLHQVIDAGGNVLITKGHAIPADRLDNEFKNGAVVCSGATIDSGKMKSSLIDGVEFKVTETRELTINKKQKKVSFILTDKKTSLFCWRNGTARFKVRELRDALAGIATFEIEP